MGGGVECSQCQLRLRRSDYGCLFLMEWHGGLWEIVANSARRLNRHTANIVVIIIPSILAG